MNQRFPAYPLLLQDPMFSLWSPSDELNGGDTTFWTGAKKRAYGLVHASGKCYCFMGEVKGAEKLAQTAVRLTAFTTEYTFDCDAFSLDVSFVSPLDLREPALMTLPVNFIRYTLTPKKALDKVSVAVLFDEDICYQDRGDVTGGVVKTAQGEAAFIGLARQQVMSNSMDNVAADWGYVYLAAKEAWYISASALSLYVKTGAMEYVNNDGERRLICGMDSLGAVTKKASGTVYAAFDDGCAIFYYGQWLTGYFYRDGKTALDAIDAARDNETRILARLTAFDGEIKAACGSNDEHYRLLCAALRQSVAAHKLVEDRDGRLLFLSKECCSNGCIATVDVSYPSAPLYLLYNPALVWGMLRPIFEFAAMPAWEFDFAPHDAGTYPYCAGQVYGMKNEDNKYKADNIRYRNQSGVSVWQKFYTYPAGNDLYEHRYQMPVEECSNMLIMTAAAESLRPDSLTRDNLPTLKKWADYLVAHGLVPDNQLCTDDFAGHCDKNANLSVKAIVGIGAYAKILAMTGESAAADKMFAIAKDYADKWTAMCYKDGRTRLTMDGEGEFSLKYNLAFDRLLGLGLFPDELYASETEAYLARMNRFGTPLDSHKAYTKSDWLMWCASLTDDPDKQNRYIHALAEFLAHSPTRVPFTDWFDTVTGEMSGFQNRTVQGGLFILLLKNAGILNAKK